jgi:serine palmitoyltransferase
VYCTSAPENPIMILVLKPQVVAAKRLTTEDQQFLLQDVVDEVCNTGFEHLKISLHAMELTFC